MHVHFLRCPTISGHLARHGTDRNYGLAGAGILLTRHIFIDPCVAVDSRLMTVSRFPIGHPDLSPRSPASFFVQIFLQLVPAPYFLVPAPDLVTLFCPLEPITAPGISYPCGLPKLCRRCICTYFSAKKLDVGFHSGRFLLYSLVFQISTSNYAAAASAHTSLPRNSTLASTLAASSYIHWSSKYPP
jgi:hypothetical protein